MHLGHALTRLDLYPLMDSMPSCKLKAENGQDAQVSPVPPEKRNDTPTVGGLHSIAIRRVLEVEDRPCLPRHHIHE
jgi:hypothetical protein